MSPRIPRRSLDLLGVTNRIFCVMMSDVRILNITLDLVARELLDP